MKFIQSAQNEQLKYLAKLLHHSKTRRQDAKTVLEGVHLLDAFLQTNQLPEQVWIPEHRLETPDIQGLLSQLPKNRCMVVGESALNKISSLTQANEITSLISIPQQKQLPISGDCVVLERVQDAGNVGTILRSACASGITQIIAGNDCADIWSPKVLRAGMGAHFSLTIFEQVDLFAWRKNYQNRVLATALTEHQNQDLYQLNCLEPSAWILGNEGSGVSPELIQQADYSVKIPMLGATESLNVAMAGTICFFEQMRQRLMK